MQPPATANQPSSIERLQHWLAHTVHWGDAPTWFAAIGGAVAALYAFRGFRSQRKQVKELADKQVLTDRLMAYQAHAYARALTADVRTWWEAAPDSAERRIFLANQSNATISNIYLTAFLNSLQCVIVEPVELLRHVPRSGPIPLPEWKIEKQLLLPDAHRTLTPGFCLRWTVRADDAPDKAQLAFNVSFADEVGSMWAHDHNEQVHFLEPEPESKQRGRIKRMFDWRPAL